MYTCRGPTGFHNTGDLGRERESEREREREGLSVYRTYVSEGERYGAPTPAPSPHQAVRVQVYSKHAAVFVAQAYGVGCM